MQVPLTKCLRIEENEIASHLTHRSDVDDLIFGKRITPCVFSGELRIQLCDRPRICSPYGHSDETNGESQN